MSRRVKIYAFPSHQAQHRTSGVDFERIIQPMTELAKHPDFEITQFEYGKPNDWLKIAKTTDIIYFNYIQDPWGYAAMGAMARKHGVKLVLDLDDALWNITSDNYAHKVWKKGEAPIKNFTAIANDVDYLTCTNPYLRNVIQHNTIKDHDRIGVLPNYIDLTLYKHRSSFKNDGRIVLMHYGSTTHFFDLKNPNFEKGIDMIMKEYPQVVFKTVGAMIGPYKEKWGQRYINDFGHEDIFHWIQDEDKFPHFMDEADIMVTPLVDHTYNRCKSGIKFLETASAGKPGVWEKIRQYEELVDGTNGLLAHTAQEWYNQIEILIKDVQLRQWMGENAYKTAQKWTIKGNIDKYVDFFQQMM